MDVAVHVVGDKLGRSVTAPVPEDTPVLVRNAPIKADVNTGIEVRDVDGLVILIGDSDVRPIDIDGEEVSGIVGDKGIEGAARDTVGAIRDGDGRVVGASKGKGLGGGQALKVGESLAIMVLEDGVDIEDMGEDFLPQFFYGVLHEDEFLKQ